MKTKVIDSEVRKEDMVSSKPEEARELISSWEKGSIYSLAEFMVVLYLEAFGDDYDEGQFDNLSEEEKEKKSKQMEYDLRDMIEYVVHNFDDFLG